MRNKEIEINLTDTPRVYLQTPQGEIAIHLTSNGEIRLSTDKSFAVLPTGSNSIELELRRGY